MPTHRQFATTLNGVETTVDYLESGPQVTAEEFDRMHDEARSAAGTVADQIANLDPEAWEVSRGQGVRAHDLLVRLEALER